MANHEDWMRLALSEAEMAFHNDEVPVGAVMVRNDELICSAKNRREALQSPLGHAEIDLIAEASEILGSWRLSDCTMYVTLEPCLMCIGASLQSRLKRIVFGARDKKAGAVRSLYSCAEDSRLNHQIEIVEGVLADESSKMLSDFFKQLRKRRSKQS